MKQVNEINEGGVNGLGESLVNTNSESFIVLKEAIRKHSASRSDADKLNDKITSLRFQMESYLSTENFSEIIPAGNFIEKLLKLTGISKKRFSAYIGYDYSNFIATLKGRRKVNPDLAIKTGKIFGISPSIWLHIETKNEILSYLKTSPPSDKYNLGELLK